MEYALIGVAAAYAASRDSRYLTALERGIEWLAAREEMTDPAWKGSWFYAYSAASPYDPVAISPGPNVQDVRGVDATSALFVYLLYLHRQLTASDIFVQRFAQHGQSALDFVIARNRSIDGFFVSSWQKRNGLWVLWQFQYSADQGDVYLGLHAGSVLYDGVDRRYGKVADFLQQNTARTFFDPNVGRYAVGRDVGGNLDAGSDFDMIFPQGYVPWVFGTSSENVAAYQWLVDGVQTDGSVRRFVGDPGYSLSVAVLAMSAATLQRTSAQASVDWLLLHNYDRDGGIRDNSVVTSSKYSNVAGFTILALLGRPAW